MGSLRNELLFARVQEYEPALDGTAPSAASAPAATDAILVRGEPSSSENPRLALRPNRIGSLSESQPVFAGSTRSLSFGCELKGSGAAGAAPEIDPLLRMCGLAPTVVADTSVAYSPFNGDAQGNHEQGLLDFYDNEAGARQMQGCQGNMQLSFTVGEVVFASFDITGHPVPGGRFSASPPTPSFDTTVPSAVRAINFRAGGVSLAIQSLTLDLGNNVAASDNANAFGGYGRVRINARAVTGQYNPEQVAVGSYNPISALEQSTQFQIIVGPIGSAAGNIIDLDVGFCSLSSQSDASRDEQRTDDLPFIASPNPANGAGEFTLTFR